VVATISKAGVFRVFSATAQRLVNVTATLANRQVVVPITVSPATPVVAVATVDALCRESGDPGVFQLVRSFGLGSTLTVPVEITGTATLGADYATVVTDVVFPVGATRALLNIVPLQDTNFEGNETVTVRVLPSANFRLGALTTASLVLRDDEPFPAGQPDVSLRRPGMFPIGVDTVDNSLLSVQQVLAVPAAANGPVVAFLNVRNRGTTPRNFTVQGPPTSLGYTVKVFVGRTDVTGSVVDGTLGVNAVPSNGSTDLVVVVTPTTSAITGVPFRGLFQVTSDTGSIDLILLQVTRVR
jgi:hypothetical protein